MNCNLLKDSIKLTSFDDINHNKSLINKLSKYGETKHIENMILFGNNGSGKYTIAKILLSKVFNDNIFNIKKKNILINLKKKNEEIEIYYSNYHYEFDLYNFKYIDMNFIIEFVKQYMSNINIFTNTYNVLIIKNFQLASRNVQFALRRIIEKKTNTCRFIFLTNSLSNIEDAILSRNLILKLNKIKETDIKNILKNIININKFTISTKKLNLIISLADGDIGKSICLLENIVDGIEINNNYEVDSLIELIESSKNILDINIIRTKIYTQLLYLTPSELIEKITLKILKEYDMNSDIRNKILQIACDADHNLLLGFRTIYHIEYFIIELNCLFN